MAGSDQAIHICDDWISIKLTERQAVIAAQAALSKANCWTEIVPGIDSIAVQFDPAKILPEEAARNAVDQLTTIKRVAATTSPTVTIPICYAPEFAPDLELVADRLGMSAEALPGWHSSQSFSVTMLGFMPGFAYLESDQDSIAIGRLAAPRQSVAAGSIGIIGRQNCIYSFSSPGGWPIIGRTYLRLFDPSRQSPALLSAGQKVRFEAISKHAFNLGSQGTEA